MSIFQTQVNNQPALGVRGDFASNNPRFSVVAGESQLVAGPNGLYVGYMAWVDWTTGEVYNTGTGKPTGFVGREQQAIIINFSDTESMWIPPGKPITLYKEGDFLADNDGTTSTTVNGVVYADVGTGKLSLASTGTTMAASFTGVVAANVIASTGSLSTNTSTASITGTTMTVATILTGAVMPGQVLTGTGVSTGTTVVRQLTGATVGAAGDYEVSISQEVTSTTVTGSGGCLTVVSMTSGTVVVGQTLSGTGVTTGTEVLAFVTGSGAAGKYYVSEAQTVSSQAITASGGTLTVSAIASGTGGIVPNAIFTGTAVTSGNYIKEGITGTGGLGTYWVSEGDTASEFADGAIAGSVATDWYFSTVVAAGETAKITRSI